MKHEIKRRSLPESVRDSLQERILNGEFREGDTLGQEKIAEEYGVSRIPVREALRQLEAQGLVEVQTHKGAVVATIPTEQVQELFELRAILESDVMARAIPRMTDQDIVEARTLLDELDDSYRRGDMASWGRLNWAFHQRLYMPASRPQTIAILQGINLQVERYVRLHLWMTDGIGEAKREHREILRLCALREADAAAAFLHGHILNTACALVAAIRCVRAA